MKKIYNKIRINISINIYIITKYFKMNLILNKDIYNNFEIIITFNFI